MARKRPKHPTATLLRVGSLRVNLLNGQTDWREYLVWQLGLLAAALSLLVILLLLWRPAAVTEVTALYVLLAALPGVALASVSLWWLIKREYSRSKRFALAFLVLSALTASLVGLGMFEAVPETGWFDLLLVGTLLYLIGTGVIGLVIFVRGDDVSPWWKR
ncbi:MAG TPA: hypothetical protein VIF43_01475 [Patescibacteria group bacterium]|jgi:uncharacterized membrane protein YhaH (DUF805 family)